jgi:hypothetical protein
MLKYDNANHRVVLACTDATEWANFEHSVQIDLFDSYRPAPVTDAASLDSSTGLFNLGAMNIDDDSEPLVLVADPQTAQTERRSNKTSTSKFGTVPCKNYAKGNCAFGNQCKFKHSS